MNVSLTPYYEALIEERVASGRYGNASEVVREALRLLEERDRDREARLRDLRAAVDDGDTSGELEPWEDAEALKEQARAYRAGRLRRAAS